LPDWLEVETGAAVELAELLTTAAGSVVALASAATGGVASGAEVAIEVTLVTGAVLAVADSLLAEGATSIVAVEVSDDWLEATFDDTDVVVTADVVAGVDETEAVAVGAAAVVTADAVEGVAVVTLAEGALLTSGTTEGVAADAIALGEAAAATEAL
jgi:hypothetical protein